MDATNRKDKRERIRRELAKNPHNADVERIVRASRQARRLQPDRPHVDRDVLFQLLAQAAVPDPTTYRREIIRMQKEWESLARRLETVAKDGEQLVSNPLAYPEGYVLGSFQAPVPPRLFRGMRIYAAYARLQARVLGTLLRKLGKAEKWNAANLLLCVRAATGSLCENELARLLTEACEIAGTKEKITADKLRKQWERHVLPIASSRKQIAIYRQKLPAEMETLRQDLLRGLDRSTP